MNIETKQKINKIIDYAGIVFLCIIIFLLNIFIGSNIFRPIYFIQFMSIIFGTIYCITKKIFCKGNIIIKGKIDIFVLLLVISTSIPLILKKYVTFNGTYFFMIKYLAMYSIYIIARNVINDKKAIKIICNTMIFSSIIVIIFALDWQYFKNLQILMEKINTVLIESNRLMGPFGYPNTMAIYMALNFFITIGCFKDTKNKPLKVIYIIYIVLNITCMILTISKSVIALVIAICLVYLLIKYRKKINKKVVVILVIITLICIISIYFLIQIPEKLQINNEEEWYYITNSCPNQEYTYEFDIYAKSNENNNQTNFVIEVVEINRYLKEETIESIEFNNYEGKKTINFKTSDDMYRIRVKFFNKEKEEFIINKMNINGQEYALNYKFVSKTFVDFLKNFNFKYKGVWQRSDFIKDGLKIVKENWLVGRRRKHLEI